MNHFIKGPTESKIFGNIVTREQTEKNLRKFMKGEKHYAMQKN